MNLLNLWIYKFSFFFMSDSVFEEEGAETSPTAAQQGDEGDKPESNSNPAEKGEQQPTQTHVGAGGIFL